jgi:four helix bundle protein
MDYRKLTVWQKSHLLVLALYKLTAKFPQAEMYGLTSQIRRAAVSISANIAEGCARGGDAEFGRFLQISKGSAGELDYHLLLAKDLKLITETEYQKVLPAVDEVRRMLSSFVTKLKKSY